VKTFSCGDVVPGCTAAFTGPDEESVFGQAAAHAAADHGVTDPPAELVALVRANIHPA